MAGEKKMERRILYVVLTFILQIRILGLTEFSVHFHSSNLNLGANRGIKDKSNNLIVPLLTMATRRRTESIEGSEGAPKCHDAIVTKVTKLFTTLTKRHSAELPKTTPPIVLKVVDYGAYNLLDPTLYKAVKDSDINTFIRTLQDISREKGILDQSILDRLSPSKNSLLHEAARFGSKKIASHIVDNFPSIVTRTNMIGDTALHVAAKFGKLHIIEVLSTVDFGKQRHGGSLEGPSHADDFVNDNKQLLRIRNHIGNTALHEAVITKNLAEVKYLVSIDPEVAYYLNEEKKSPFYLAVETNDKDILKALLEEARDLNDAVERPRPRGESPIYAIILKRNKEMLEEIAIKNQILFHIRDTKGKTPLYFAASKGFHEGVTFLLKYSKQSTLERSKKGNFPIHAACKNGYVDIVNKLLEPQYWPNPTELLNNEGQNILHIAAKSGENDVVKNLLRNPKLEMLDANAKDNLGNTALHLASMNLHPNVVCSLTWEDKEDKRVDLELRNNDGLTAVDVLLDRVSMPPSTLREVPPSTLRETFAFVALLSAGTKISDAGKKILRRRSTPAPKQIKDMVNLLPLVTILLATVTFAAGLTVPGGFNSTDKDTGIATLVHKGMFQIFIICDTIAMYCSILGTFILLGALQGDYKVAFRVVSFALYLVLAALFTASLAFMSAVFVVVSKVTWLAIVVLITGIVFLTILSTIYIMLLFPFESSNPVFHYISHYIIIFMFRHTGGNYRVDDYLKKKESDRLAEKDKDKQIQGSSIGRDSV